MQNYTKKYILKRFLKEYVFLYKTRLIISTICMIVVAVSLAAQVQLVEPTINGALGGNGMIYVYMIAGAFLIIAVVKGLASYVQNVFMQHILLSVERHLKKDMYRALMRADISYLEGQGTAKHLARFSSDLGNLTNLIKSFFLGIIKESLSAITLFMVMFYNSYQMTIFAFFVLPLTLLPIIKISRKLESMSLESLERIGDMTGTLDDTLKGARQIKSYNLLSYATKMVSNTFDKVFAVSLKAERTSALANPVLELSTGLIVACVLVWGGYLVQTGQLDAGRFMAFFVALTTAYQPIKSLANLNLILSAGIASAKRVFSIMDMVPSIRNSKGSQPLKFKVGNIKFNNIDFDYETRKNILKNISIDVKSGQSISLVGPSGGGKSTLLNLMPRFFDPVKGTIEIDGQDIKTVTLESLRDVVSLVSQETILFNTTIRDNVMIGREDASEEEIIQALKDASAWKFVQSMQDGIDSKVGERGLQLSGGQRQRISIARAFLKNAPILLLDEATSALDTESEHQIQEALGKLSQGRTTISIAHRLSTIQNSDMIYVIDNGRVVENGTHAHLKEKNGIYTSLCSKQEV